jgi:hypothetical protein
LTNDCFYVTSSALHSRPNPTQHPTLKRTSHSGAAIAKLTPQIVDAYQMRRVRKQSPTDKPRRVQSPTDNDSLTLAASERQLEDMPGILNLLAQGRLF